MTKATREVTTQRKSNTGHTDAKSSRSSGATVQRVKSAPKGKRASSAEGPPNTLDSRDRLTRRREKAMRKSFYLAAALAQQALQILQRESKHAAEDDSHELAEEAAVIATLTEPTANAALPLTLLTRLAASVPSQNAQNSCTPTPFPGLNTKEADAGDASDDSLRSSSSALRTACAGGGSNRSLWAEKVGEGCPARQWILGGSAPEQSDYFAAFRETCQQVGRYTRNEEAPQCNSSLPALR